MKKLVFLEMVHLCSVSTCRQKFTSKMSSVMSSTIVISSQCSEIIYNLQRCCVTASLILLRDVTSSGSPKGNNYALYLGFRRQDCIQQCIYFLQIFCCCFVFAAFYQKRSSKTIIYPLDFFIIISIDTFVCLAVRAD